MDNFRALITAMENSEVAPAFFAKSAGDDDVVDMNTSVLLGGASGGFHDTPRTLFGIIRAM